MRRWLMEPAFDDDFFRTFQVVYGEGKTPEQLLAILQSMGDRRRRTEEEEEEDDNEAAAVPPAASSAPGAGAAASRGAAAGPIGGLIVASRVSAEKHAALRALMRRADGGAPALEVRWTDIDRLSWW